MYTINSVAPGTLEQLWESALKQCQNQMTRATFDAWLLGTTLRSAENGLYLIEVKSDLARDWLEHRLCTSIQRVLSDLVGQETTLQFVVAEAELPAQPEDLPTVDPLTIPRNGSGSEPASGNLTPDPNSPLQPEVHPASELDFEYLWRKTGFTQVPDYAIRFWRIHLGRAFDLWEFLVSQDQRDVKLMQKKEIPYWTPPRRYTYRSLSSLLGCGRKTLTGRLVPCWVFETQKEQSDNAEGICCGKYPFHQMRINEQGEPECLHWLEGVLERLYREGLLAVERVQHPGKPRSHELRLQAWRLLPLLAPSQVTEFKSEADKERHRAWLEKHGHHVGLDVTTWERLKGETLVTSLPNYTWGRELTDVYQNNPLQEEEVEE